MAMKKVIPSWNMNNSNLDKELQLPKMTNGRGEYYVKCHHCNGIIDTVTAEFYHNVSGLAFHFTCHSCSLEYRSLKNAVTKLK